MTFKKFILFKFYQLIIDTALEKKCRYGLDLSEGVVEFNPFKSYLFKVYFNFEFMVWLFFTFWCKKQNMTLETSNVKGLFVTY